MGTAERTQRPGIILFVSLQGRDGWLFQWPSTGDPFYRIVLRGQQIDLVVDSTNSMQSYLYDKANFIDYPPPLEIMPVSSGLAASEINPPFVQVQWYGDPTAVYYQVQELVSAVWTPVFEITEVGAPIYSWQSYLLADASTHQYQVVSFNSLDQGSAGMQVTVSVVTPPDFVETDYTITYDNTGHQIVLALIP